MRQRGFEVIAAYEGCGVRLPSRRTGQSAGYDIEAAEPVTLEPGVLARISTGLKAFMAPDEVLIICIRSSLAAKYGLMLANGVGVIDADYYGNAENDGHIMIPLLNMGENAFHVERGMRIAQGIFTRYLLADGDAAGHGSARSGGFGSTGI